MYSVGCAGGVCIHDLRLVGLRLSRNRKLTAVSYSSGVHANLKCMYI